MRMTMLGGFLVLGLAIGSAGVAEADTLGSWIKSMSTTSTDNVQHTWGALNKGGWKTLPQNIVQGSGPHYSIPLCLQESQDGAPRWLGAGVPWTATGGAINARCSSYVTNSAKSGTFFVVDATKPAPVWKDWDSSKPEPRGAVLVSTQSPVPRRLYACRSASSSPALGYIGDDAKCYVSSNADDRDPERSVVTSYQVLVASNASADIEPRYGWVRAAPGYMPFGPMAKLEEPTGPGPGGIVEVRTTPKMHTVCRVRDGGQWWPGYLRESDFKCAYFTWNGQTQKKESADYEVHRNGSYPLSSPYRFNSAGGKPTHACTAFKNGQGPIVGFTNNPDQCTDGSRTDGNKIKLLDLPNADHGRG